MSDNEAELALTEFFVPRDGDGVMDSAREISLVDAGMRAYVALYQQHTPISR